MMVLFVTLERIWTSSSLSRGCVNPVMLDCWTTNIRWDQLPPDLAAQYRLYPFPKPYCQQHCQHGSGQSSLGGIRTVEHVLEGCGALDGQLQFAPLIHLSLLFARRASASLAEHLLLPGDGERPLLDRFTRLYSSPHLPCEFRP